MKRLFFALFLAIVPLFPTQAQDVVEIRQVNVDLVDTPKFEVAQTKSKRSEPQKWLEVEVEFDVAKEFIEELTVKYHLALTPLLKSKDQHGYLTGEVTHINVRKGKGKYSIMYVAPGSLEFFNEGKHFDLKEVEEIGVEIYVRGAVADQFNKVKGDSFGPWWFKLQPISGHLLNKNQTPFSPLFWDRYEQIKVDVR